MANSKEKVQVDQEMESTGTFHNDEPLEKSEELSHRVEDTPINMPESFSLISGLGIAFRQVGIVVPYEVDNL